jgi:tripartite-type tricarboxylate transporter receptor subunit TctC
MMATRNKATLRIMLSVAVAALLCLDPGRASAAYPDRNILLIVPFAPGGPTDVCARLIAQKLSEQLGRQFYVENVPGAGGNIGTGLAARAKPDGYSLLIAVNSHVINPALYDNVPYDPFRDFEPVSLAAAFASAFSVNPSVPASTVKELVGVIKANPGKYSFASPAWERPRIFWASNSALRSASTLCTSPSAAALPPSRRWWRATRPLALRRCRWPLRSPGTASCACSR